MWNVCLLVGIFYKASATRGVLFRCRTGPLIEVVMIGFWCFVSQIEMEWKPRPLCSMIESNSGNSGFALEIPLNHKIQICLATTKETITELWILYLLEVIMIKCFPSLCDREQRSTWGHVLNWKCQLCVLLSRSRAHVQLDLTSLQTISTNTANIVWKLKAA